MADRKLGYIPPLRILDEHRFRHIWLKDGTKRTIAHLSAHYDAASATPPPTTVDYWSKAAAGLSQMYRNDVHGCCVISGKDHLVNVWAMNDTAGTFIASGAEVDSDYVSFCGPGDNGCNITSVLDKMKSTGMLMSGSRHKIGDYVSVNNADKLLVQVSIYLFGGLTIGFSLPAAWYNNANPGFLWDVVPRGASIVGGHDVSLVGYDTTGVYVSTWGVVGRMTWAALAQSLITECYAMLSPEWTGQDNLAPNGVNVAGLMADMAMIENGQIPDPGPTPVPPVPPVPIPPTPVPPVPGPGPYAVWMCPAGVYVAEPGLTATLDGSVLTVTGNARR